MTGQYVEAAGQPCDLGEEGRGVCKVRSALSRTMPGTTHGNCDRTRPPTTKEVLGTIGDERGNDHRGRQEPAEDTTDREDAEPDECSLGAARGGGEGGQGPWQQRCGYHERAVADGDTGHEEGTEGVEEASAGADDGTGGTGQPCCARES